MIIARTLLKLWSSELDQIDPYNVPELFRGVPRPKTDFQKSRVLVILLLPHQKIESSRNWITAPAQVDIYSLFV